MTETSSWPIYFKDKLHIANLQSNVGLVTLWTPMQVLLPRLNQESFCIGGQLYSKRGINFIIRNILANPTIDTILICGANLSGSAEALMNLIDKGVDSENNVLDVDKAPVDKEIDLDALETFRKNVRYVNLIGNSSFAEIQSEIDKVSKKSSKVWANPQTFADPEPLVADKFPSEKTGFVIRADLIKHAWPQVLRHIMKFGSEKGMIKVGVVKELVNIITVIEEENPYRPDIPNWFSFNEEDLKLYYKGFFSKDANDEDYNYGERIFSHPLGTPNERYNSPNNTQGAENFRNRFFVMPDSDPLALQSFSEEGASDPSSLQNTDRIVNIKGHVGQITLNQIEEVYLKLKRYKYDRGGVISIWNPWVDNVAEGWMSNKSVKKAGNVPCMTQLQFSYREHKLQLTAYFRSNDMFDAWPRNAFALRKLQFDLAKELDVKPGYLTVISSLAQIYENNFDEANKILEKCSNVTNCRPDQRGNVIIEVIDKEIVVKHMDTSGNEILQEFRVDGTKPDSAQKMSDTLLQNLVFSEMPHAMDIARQLQKAEIAVKNGWKFGQDRELEVSS